MVGMFKSWSPIAVACVLLANASADRAFGEVLKGQSAGLGIQFEAVGGSTWCQPDITVRLTAGNASAFKSEVPEFVRMIGRIRAIVTDQCPAAERILFDALVQNRAVTAIEITRLTKWRRLFNVDVRTRKPVCSPQAQDCTLRAEAYLVTHRIMRGERFAQTELTSVMDQESEAHAVWLSGDVIGKLTVQNRSVLLGRYSSISNFADAIMSGIVHQCAGEGARQERPWSETWPEGPNTEIAVRGVSCRSNDDPPIHHTLLVTPAGDQIQIFAFWTRSEDGESTRAAVKHVAMGISHAR